MNDDDRELSNAVLLLIDQEKHAQALSAIEALPERIKGGGLMLIAKADCLYEMKEDLAALEHYVKYVTRFPDGAGGKGFALVGAAMALKNLDLQSHAKAVLDLVDDTHVGKEDELLHSAEILERQRRAKELLRPLGLERSQD